MQIVKVLAVAGVAAAALSAASAASAAGVLYSNGPINGTINAWNITAGQYQVSDSFTLSQTSRITGVTFGAWTDPGATLDSVDWGISTSPFSDNGTAAPAGTFVTVGFDYYDVSSETISFAPVTLAAGTYWINLSNGVTSDGGNVYWDENDGPSSAQMADANGNNLGPGYPAGSQAFQILGTAVPEPATWAMMMFGVFGVGALMRSRRRHEAGMAVA